MIVGIFGGSFNPPHLAHVLAVTTVLTTHSLEKVVVIPTFQHPFGKALASYDDRIAMCEQAVGWLPRVEVSRVEEQLGGKSRTLRTLTHLAARHPNWQMRTVLGADILAESDKWQGFDAICALAPPIVLGRVGVDTRRFDPPFQHLAQVLPDISSTDIRAHVAAGKWDSLAEVVPQRVLAHIRDRHLYAS